nr:hypothetical protein Iba_chr03cCG4260 [Ipomoea batatas]
MIVANPPKHRLGPGGRSRSSSRIALPAPPFIRRAWSATEAAFSLHSPAVCDGWSRTFFSLRRTNARVSASVARHGLHPPSLLLNDGGGGKHRRRSSSPTAKRNSVAATPPPPVLLQRRGTVRVRVAVELNGTLSSVPADVHGGVPRFPGVATVEPGSVVEALRRGPGGVPYSPSSASYG